MYQIKLSKKEFNVYGDEIFQTYWYHKDGSFNLINSDSTVFTTSDHREAQIIIERHKEKVNKHFAYLESVGELGMFTAKEVFSSWNRCNKLTIEKIKEKK